jgi:hypothetical protein
MILAEIAELEEFARYVEFLRLLVRSHVNEKLLPTT